MTRACFLNATKRNQVDSRAGLGKYKVNPGILLCQLIKQISKNSGGAPEFSRKGYDGPNLEESKHQREKRDYDCL